MRNIPAAVVLLAALACSKGKPATGPDAQAAVTPVEPAFVVAVVTLRKEPVVADRIQPPGGGKLVTNYLPTTLQRGERITVLDTRDEWVRVRTSDDKEGWLRASSTLDGAGVVAATILQPADVFDRPDLLAANAKRKVDPGTLLLVVKARPPFSEVNVPGTQNAWVLTERLATGEREVGVAKLIGKARWLVKSNRKDDAARILELARGSFADVPLVQILEAELNPPPAADPSLTPTAGAEAP
ncbi:MAG: SH3 domain-containing protein [Anaeromyxobacteraceae bacterium]